MINPEATNRSEAWNAFLGSVEIFLGRRDGIRRFDMSVDGFWRSFGAIIYILPFYASSVAVEHRFLLADPTAAVSSSAFIAARAIDLAIDWVSMPIALALLARQLQITRTYAAYVIVGNWASLLIFAPQALLSLLAGIGLISMDSAALLSLVVVGIMLRYHYVIIGLTLGRSPLFRIGIVAANFGLSLVLGGIIDQLFGV